MGHSAVLALSIMAVLIILAIEAQIWLGILLTFDTDHTEGSLLHFNKPAAEQTQEQSGRGNTDSPSGTENAGAS